ncbi:MAG: long-chain fatty acid--CoA ligase [Gammaproteobacteria bacterium]|nr:long-chain fatty acid--CoA ligase [Gammaproteobacteria bacterium]
MPDYSEDLINSESAVTLHGLFAKRCQRSPERSAYIQYDNQQNQWQHYSWRAVATRVAQLQQTLQQLPLETGDRVAISLKNGCDWIVFEQAALGLGLVVIPLYTDDRPENIAYIIEDAGVKCLLLQDAARWRRIQPTLKEETALQWVYLHHGSAEESEESKERGGTEVRLLPQQPSASDAPLITREIDGHTLATIVYTSGTTGRPKGVMLSHHNILSIAHAALTMVDVYREDRFLSFLPISHTLERTAGYYLPMMSGSTVGFSRSVAQLADDMAALQPTVMVVVPRIFERIYSKLQAQLQQGSLTKRLIFNYAVSVGWQHFEYQQKRRHWHPRLLLQPLLHRLVGEKVLARFGGRLRLAVSGGAPLGQQIARTFIGLGIPLLQGYGLTETSPVVSVNLPDRNDPQSVGVPLRGVEVRIGKRDELLIKGPGVMLGYWNNHAATAKMVDNHGWLHSGDQARIENGHIYITGRIKDILVLSNGEKIPPGDIELAIANDALVEQVLVIGEGQPFLAALVVLNAENWPAFAQRAGLDPMSAENLHHKTIHSQIINHIRQQLHGFPAYAKIRKVALTLEPWTVDNGMLTPTLKVKRQQVLSHFAKEVAAIYDEVSN